MSSSLLGSLEERERPAAEEAAELDLHCVTDRLWTGSAPSSARSARSSSSRRHKEDASQASSLSSSRKRPRNAPQAVRSFLQQHYASPSSIQVLCVNLSDQPILQGWSQAVHVPWRSLGPSWSETPTLQTLLESAYILLAWLSESPQHVAWVTCANGLSRTALVVATYLKVAGRVDRTYDGFGHFCARRTTTKAQSAPKLPPSLQHSLFRQVDDLVELHSYRQTKPLLLKAISIQGLPVEKAPRVDVYSLPSSPSNQTTTTQQPLYSTTNAYWHWSDEEGLFPIDKVVHGDFCVLVRLLGDEHDPTRLLVRYVQHTGFVAAAPCEVGLSRVDVPKRYQSYFDEHEFLLTLVWEASWQNANVPSSSMVELYPPRKPGADARNEGWRLLVQYHSIQPSRSLPDSDEDSLTQKIQTLVHELHCPEHLAQLALQLHRSKLSRAKQELLYGFMSAWWKPPAPQSSNNEQDAPVTPKTPRGALFESETGQSERHRKRQEALQQRVLDVVRKVDLQAGIPKEDLEASGVLEDPESPTESKEDGSRWRRRRPDEPRVQPRAADLQAALGNRRSLHPLRRNTPLQRGAKPLLPWMPRGNVKPLVSEYMAIEDPANAAAVELLARMEHPGISLEDLLQLQKDFKEWSKTKASSLEAKVDDSKSDLPLKKDPKYEKYWRMKNVGLPEGAVRNAMLKDGVDTVILEWDWDQSYASQSGDKPPETPSKEPTIKEDPRFLKYWKMRSVGLPEGAIRNAMQRDGVDQAILAMDWDRSLESQSPSKPPKGDGPGTTDNVPIKSDPRFEKYVKMRSVGLPDGAIQNAMQRDSVDPAILGMNWDQSYESQTVSAPSNASASELAIQDDPRFVKYAKMKSVGLPEGAIRNAMQRDEVDTSILDLDWTKSLASQTGGTAVAPSQADSEPAIKDDPRFEKYAKMKSVGLPDGAIRNAMQRDEVDTSILDLDWSKSLASQTGGSAAGGAMSDNEPAIKDDPRFEKYAKMKSVGLPEGAIRNAMLRDGVDVSILDLDWDRSLISQRAGKAEVDTGIPLKDDEEYKKYFKMMKMGLPKEAVKNALIRDGKDPAVIDMDPEKSVEFQQRKGGAQQTPAKKKKKVRRKKIFWNTIDPDNIKEDSLWSLVRNKFRMTELKYDEKEFETLFTETADPGQKKSAAEAKPSKAKKKAVQVVDGKRSMNGGIILLRLKLDYHKIAKMVENLEYAKLESTQIKALKEFLPTIDERQALLSYMKKAGPDEAAQKKAFDDLSECEKYMIVMKDVENAAAKFDCMLFRTQFRNRFQDVVDPIELLDKACDEVRSSEKLREILGLILTVVNQINTGDDGDGAHGFNLDALLKLNEAKAFDKKTSVLQYLVRFVKQNDESLLNFSSDLVHVASAENVILDSIQSEVAALKKDLEAADLTATEDAEFQQKNGRTTKMTLEELKEQRTSVRNIKSVPQYTMIEHQTGRTRMERFMKVASVSVDDIAVSLAEVQEKYTSLLGFFGEDEKMASNDFFGTMRKFIKEFQKAVDVVEKEEKAKVGFVALSYGCVLAF